MQTILITTDFSSASAHALDYACTLFDGKNVRLELIYILPVSVSYTSDGIALTSLQQEIDRAEESLETELKRVHRCHNSLQIQSRVRTGSFLKTLQEETSTLKPMIVVIGTSGFSEVYLGDEDPLNALRKLEVPVLFIPAAAAIKPIKNMAFASNYSFSGKQVPIAEIIAWSQFIQATNLQVVHVDAELPENSPQQTTGQAWYQEQLASLNPTFTWVQHAKVIDGLTGFIVDQNIDCVLVVPRKYGIWQTLFHSSYTKALARLNRVPVIAFPEHF